MSPHDALAYLAPYAKMSSELCSLVSLRLEQGEEDYGENYLQWEEGQVLTEIKEEIADVIGYALLEMSRVGAKPKMIGVVEEATRLFSFATGDTE